MQRVRVIYKLVAGLVVLGLLSGCTVQLVPPSASSSEGDAPAVMIVPVEQTPASAASSAVTATEQITTTEAVTVAEPVTVTEPVTEPVIASAATPPQSPEEIAAQFAIPQPENNKFNVAFVLSSPIGDGGWGYAHNEGRLIVDKYIGEKVHTGLVESVPEGPVSEIIIRKLAEAGFDAIFTCSFGYMDPTAQVAAEFPNKYFVHISGFKKNDSNFANMFGSMESMKYVAGMIAGARALEDGSMRVGYVAPFPFAEVTRYVNATALGMRRTCPECVMDVRWTMSWFDPEGERAAAREMLDAGATVILTGADTTGPVEEAAARGLWGIGYDSDNACDVAPEHCLTTTYWDWGQVYIWLINKMIKGTFTGQDYYFEADSNGVGLLGFMAAQTPAPGVPKAVITEVRVVLDAMLRGQLTRFDLFSGPIKNNQGELIVAKGQTLTQSDLEGLRFVEDREDCTICMNWLVEGILPELELPTLE